MRIRILLLTLSLLAPGMFASAQAPGSGGSSSPPAARPRGPGRMGNATAFVVQFKVKAGKGREFEQVFRGAEQKVGANEPGNLSYDLYRNGQPDTFVVIERYKDPAAVAAHGKDVGGLMKQLGDLLDGRPKVVEVLTLVSAK